MRKWGDMKSGLHTPIPNFICVYISFKFSCVYQVFCIFSFCRYGVLRHLTAIYITDLKSSIKSSTDKKAQNYRVIISHCVSFHNSFIKLFGNIFVHCIITDIKFTKAKTQKQSCCYYLQIIIETVAGR